MNISKQTAYADEKTRRELPNVPSPREKLHSIIAQKVVQFDTFDRSGLVFSVSLIGGGTIDVQHG